MAVNDKNKPATAPINTKVRRSAEDDVYTGTPMSLTGIRGHLTKSVLWKMVLGLLIFIFAVGFALTAIAPPSGPGGAPRGGGPARVATVGSQVVDRTAFENTARQQVEMMAQFGQKTDPTGLMALRQRALDGLVQNATEYDVAVEQGFTPTSSEVDAEIEKKIKEYVKSQEGTNPTAFRRKMEAEFGSMAKFEENARKNMEAQREGVAKELAIEKLKKSIQDKNTVTEADYKKSVTKLDLYQINIRPKPIDPVKDKDVKAATDKHKAEAKARAEKLAASLKNADLATFKATAQKESDDIATKSKGGALGLKLISEITAPQPEKDAIEKATGKVVGPLENEYNGGFDIFFINARKEELPKDYAKKKAELIKAYETTKDDEAWQKYTAELKKTRPPEILDPALQAYKIQMEKVFAAPADQQKSLRADALAKYQEALASAAPEESAAIHYQMAQLYQMDTQPAKQIESLEAAVKESNDATLRVQLAGALHAAKREKEALEQLKQASKRIDENPSPPSPFGGGNPDDNLRMQIASTYDMLGKKDLAMAERKKIKPAAPGGMGGMGGNSPFNIQPQIR